MEAEKFKLQAQTVLDDYDFDNSGYIDAADLEKVYKKWGKETGLPYTEKQIKESVALSNISPAYTHHHLTIIIIAVRSAANNNVTYQRV